MREHTSAPAAIRPGASLLGAVSALLGAVLMGAAARSLHELAQTSHGSETLIVWVLLALAALGVLLCLHLALVWGLTVAILLAGPASRTGAALLGTLRILAPRTARRLAGGAAVATAATVLTLTPGMASEHHFGPDPEEGGSSAPRSAEQVWTEMPPMESSPDLPPPDSDGSGDPLPPLGWGEGPAPATAGDPVAPPTGTAEDQRGEYATASGSRAAPARIVVVHRGDSLWSISDDLLGPGPSDPAEIAAAWPLLHDSNRDVIGDDPDLLRPGQQLTIPAELTTQDMS